MLVYLGFITEILLLSALIYEIRVIEEVFKYQ